MDLGLKGKVAIVAAASKGLGRAVAAELAREGAQVAICSRDAALEQAAKASSRRRAAVFRQALDVADYAAVQKFLAAVEAKLGRVDICVTNAGGPPAKKFADITIEEWRVAVELTLMSAVYFAKEVLPRMQKTAGGG